MAKKTIFVGRINGLDSLLHAPKGHQAHISGSGAHRDYNRDKKVRRAEDKRRCRE